MNDKCPFCGYSEYVIEQFNQVSMKKCSKCGSTDIHKMTIEERVRKSRTAYMLFSKAPYAGPGVKYKNYECLNPNCQYKW